jgi:hypothetical protein
MGETRSSPARRPGLRTAKARMSPVPEAHSRPRLSKLSIRVRQIGLVNKVDQTGAVSLRGPGPGSGSY